MIFFKENIKILRKKAGLTQGNIAEYLGVNPNTVSNYEKGNSSPDFSQLEKLVNILDIDAHTLLYVDLAASGENILNTRYPTTAYNENVGEDVGHFVGTRKNRKTPTNIDLGGGTTDMIIQRTFPLRTDRCIGIQNVPLYELDATAGLVSLFVDAKDLNPICHISLPNLPPCDGALFVRGDSMYPILKSGDIVLYKTVPDLRDGIMWGEMYLVSFELNGEEFISIKYIQKGYDSTTVRLVSHNQHHSPKDIPLANIRALALIKASVRYNTMG